ncbi:MAG: hypothetical protein QNI97_12405 [Desulfobacterales bacterium]|nr:hypothetical protein [Desulfobacterales bacterium]
MRFTFLLFALGQILKIAAITSKPFKHYIRNTDARVLIKTEDNSRARLFVFNKGRVSSQAGHHDAFDVALIFKDAATGFSVLTSKRKDASFNAAAEGKLKVAGMSFFAQWFEDATKIILS